MAASLTAALSRPAAAAPISSRSRHLRSGASELSRGSPLRAAAPPAGGRPFSSRDRTPLSVAAFQLPSRKWWEAKHPPNVVHISSVQQLVDTMATAGDRLVIVDFFAPWCAACKGLYPKLMKVMEERPDVLLLTVNFDENKTLVKALGVKVLPYFLFYRGAEGKLEGFSASSKRIGLIQDAIERHTTPRCYLDTADGAPVLPEFPNVVPKGELGSRGSNSQVAPEERAQLRPMAEPQPVV